MKPQIKLNSTLKPSIAAGDKDLVIAVHNKHNVLLPDTFVARVTVPLCKIEAGGCVQHYPLLNKKDEQIADISLEMNITDGTHKCMLLSLRLFLMYFMQENACDLPK